MRKIIIILAVMLIMSILIIRSHACEEGLLHDGDLCFGSMQCQHFAEFVANRKLAEEQASERRTEFKKSYKKSMKAYEDAKENMCDGCSIPCDNLGTFKATAYCSCSDCSDGYGTMTATGTKCHKGTVAVDPTVIPLGSKLFIEFEDGSILEAVAEDTGGAIKGKKIDIYMTSHTESNYFGRQKVKVYKLTE